MYNVGGHGGEGGQSGGTGGTGGAGEGNQLEFHLVRGNITLNVGGRDRDIDFVFDMVMRLACLGISTLALACLHLALVVYFSSP